MPFKVFITTEDDSWMEDEVFQTYEEAEEYGLICMSDMSTGAEIMELNPNLGSPSYSNDFEVVEVYDE